MWSRDSTTHSKNFSFGYYEYECSCYSREYIRPNILKSKVFVADEQTTEERIGRRLHTVNRIVRSLSRAQTRETKVCYDVQTQKTQKNSSQRTATYDDTVSDTKRRHPHKICDMTNLLDNVTVSLMIHFVHCSLL
jgi:hypothetical protein